MQPRVLILRAPGTNCDRETAFAFETAGARAATVHLNRLLEKPSLAADYQILCIPGGFSYGDDICAGRIFGNQMRHHLRDTLHQFKNAGKLILGICNGFQILIKSGVLLPDRADEPIATLTLNDSGKFEDRWVHLRVASPKCVFLAGIERMYLPVAHAEGKFVARDTTTLAKLDQEGQLVLRYAVGEVQSSTFKVQSSDPTLNLEPGTWNSVPYPACPNGAQLAVAGLCDETGRVFGLMPHPERHIDPTQHPHWTREQPTRGDGVALFENAVRFFA
ncbi:MAG: phosphoribosylformylglycinamidine synthase subunit PurQ [Pirellulaceae bacterium]|nr:phosphoribosylformylglycinamidine synthase subunit PurQ [Pirellulaceae bacterium]